MEYYLTRMNECFLITFYEWLHLIPGSTVVSISTCHAEDSGSSPDWVEFIFNLNDLSIMHKI